MKVVMEMERTYLCIDLKTFYASVECVERHLDPFKTDLIVADPERSKGAICLAISPKMKARGIRNRCRIWEIPKDVHPIIAKPRMKKYIAYSASIYAIYLRYIAKEDIHPYSIDEMFLDVTSYLKLYQKNAFELAQMLITEIYRETGITATCGIGTNLYLAKVALDIMAKKNTSHLAFLDEETYQKTLAHHVPLTDFWRINNGIEQRLHKLHIRDMADIRAKEERVLYKEFGVNAGYLIDHAWGREPCTIADIKAYHPQNKSLSNSQILYRDYNTIDARIVLTEMVDNLVLQLVEKHFLTYQVGFYIHYSKEMLPPLKVTIKLKRATDGYATILKRVLEEYDYRIQEKALIRRISVVFAQLVPKQYEQLSFFTSFEETEKESKLEEVMVSLKHRFGKNMILRATSYQEGATQRERNKLIGGHNAE